MRLSQIEAAVTRGDHAAGDFDVKGTLRFEVIPAFYRLVKEARWLRKVATMQVSSASRYYSLADDFRSMTEAFLNSTERRCELTYIGENAEFVAAAELSTTPARPSGFYIVPRTTDGLLRGLKFNATPDSTYLLVYVYRSGLVFANDNEDYELDRFIPEDFQPALINELKAEMLWDRYGIGDQRGDREHAKFLAICEQAVTGGTDLARRNHHVYVR